MKPEEKEEILNSYKWIKVPKYVDDQNLTWEERYHKLNAHHIQETTFLIDKIRSILNSEDTTIDFTSYEINALNKLHGSVKFGSDLDADEINMFATSPFINSSHQKIHAAYLNCIKMPGNPLYHMDATDASTYFMLNATNNYDEIKTRLHNLNDSTKEYIRELDDAGLESYCLNLFGPFTPTKSIKNDIIKTLRMVAGEKE